MSALLGLSLTACRQETPKEPTVTPKTYSEEYYSGGELGTVFNATALAYQQPAPAVENAGMSRDFQIGEALFERDFNENPTGAFRGLGPLAVRPGCLYCHPAYGHGKRQTEYNARQMEHKLCMQNDIRTGWCRTTPLWGRGLSKLCTGGEDRLHDCRAKNVIEAIMWHGSKESDARASVEQFRQLDKADRDAIVKFIDAI